MVGAGSTSAEPGQHDQAEQRPVGVEHPLVPVDQDGDRPDDAAWGGVPVLHRVE